MHGFVDNILNEKKNFLETEAMEKLKMGCHYIGLRTLAAVTISLRQFYHLKNEQRSMNRVLSHI